MRQCLAVSARQGGLRKFAFFSKKLKRATTPPVNSATTSRRPFQCTGLRCSHHATSEPGLTEPESNCLMACPSGTGPYSAMKSDGHWKVRMALDTIGTTFDSVSIGCASARTVEEVLWFGRYSSLMVNLILSSP